MMQVVVYGADFGREDSKAVIAVSIGNRYYIVPEYLHPWADRVEPYVDERGLHWLWTGWCNGKGHAKAKIAGRTVYLYRWLYEQLTGEKLERFDYIDHTCKLKPCMTAHHWEPVTPRENTVRGPGADNWFKEITPDAAAS